MRVVKELMTVGKKVSTRVEALANPPAPGTIEVTTEAPGGSTLLAGADAETEAELEAGDCPPLDEPGACAFEADEADGGLEPPDVEIAGCPLDVKGNTDAPGWPDDAELAAAPLRAELRFEPPAM